MTERNEGSPPVVCFGPFEADVQTHELRKHGVRLRLPEQSFQVLRMLLERPGNLVTREELQKDLWPSDTFVDFDHGLSAAVNRLREALGDSADEPKFIETLPRRGYRFIGEVSASVLSEIVIEPDRVKPPRTIWLKIAAGILTALVCAAGVGLGYRWFRHGPPLQPARSLTPLPFTALPGVETSPSFSPDGSRIAFAWNGDPSSNQKGFDLYVKGIGSETMLRLTQHPSEWLSPVWSPDGTQIAFHRIAGADTGIYAIPSLGGPEKKLRSTRAPYVGVTPISWSPDGKWIAFAESSITEFGDRISLLSVETLEVRAWPHNPKCNHEAQPKFSHSGRSLSYVCVGNRVLEMYSVPLAGGTPQLVVTFADGSFGSEWSADDTRLLFSQRSPEGSDLREVDLSNLAVRQFLFSSSASWPSISARGNRLAYSVASESVNIWRRDLLHPKSPAVKLIFSTRRQNNAQYSPDGRFIAFESTRAGMWDLWMSNSDGTNPVQLSRLNLNTGHPRWSPDGQKIAFHAFSADNLKQPEVYVVDISERIPRKLLTNLKTTYDPTWSQDGKWIYVRSKLRDESAPEICRLPSGGGQAVPLSTMSEGLDHEVFYFADRRYRSTISGVSLRGDHRALPLNGMPQVNNWNAWTTVRGGIYFVPVGLPDTLRYYDFASRELRDVLKLQKDFSDGLSISPDGRYLLYSQLDDLNSDIMVVENFQ
jgi:Tol biopolymer transport system component/DNA-binding winged helix-turn-helix (wHTH) protein